MIYRPKKDVLLRCLPKSVVLTSRPGRDKKLYLTFDGPNPLHTPAVLDLLRTHDAHASFFLIGREAERYPQLVERIVAEDTTSAIIPTAIRFQWIAAIEQLAEIDRTDQLLASFDGIKRHRFRPPRGAFSFALMLHSAASAQPVVLVVR